MEEALRGEGIDGDEKRVCFDVVVGGSVVFCMRLLRRR